MFGLLFEGMVEHERSATGGMPNGRIMMASIFRHFQLDRDRIGVLVERSLLRQSVANLEAFRDKYQCVLSAIPIDDSIIWLTNWSSARNLRLTRPSKLPGEAIGALHLGWNAIDSDHQKHRDGFEKNLKLKPTVLTSTTSREKPATKSTAPAAPAPSGKPPGPKAKTKGKL